MENSITSQTKKPGEKQESLVNTNPEITLRFPKINLTSADNIDWLNTKVEVNEDIGIVKYIGPWKHKKWTGKAESEIWIGIEWEDTSRGKHDGTVEGFEYFHTSSGLKNGSLVKLIKANIGQSFLEAIDFKYNFYDAKSNDYHQFIDKAIETDNYIQANKKQINIELVGKSKAAKEFSMISKMVCVDWTCSYIRTIGTDLLQTFPRLREVILTKTLLQNWSDLLTFLLQLPFLTLLNFSENICHFDNDVFTERISKIKSGEIKLYWDILVLNKCNIDYYLLIHLSPLFKTVDKLYLMGNDWNFDTYTNSPNKQFIDENIKSISENTPKLTYLSWERNKIKQFFFSFKMFSSPKVRYVNLNQNCLAALYSNPDDDIAVSVASRKDIIEILKRSITYISWDYNMFLEKHYISILWDWEDLCLQNVDILNNSFIDKIGSEKVKTEWVGRIPAWNVLNHSTVTKIMRRDYEKWYLKCSVENYIEQGNQGEKITEANFDMSKFNKYMEIYHKQYFVWKKKYFDPLDEFINWVEKKAGNTIKGNMVEVTFASGDQVIKKKFPKTTTIANLRNLLVKLLKMDGSVDFGFYLESIKEGKEEKLVDETVTLMSLNITSEHRVVLK